MSLKLNAKKKKILTTNLSNTHRLAKRNGLRHYKEPLMTVINNPLATQPIISWLFWVFFSTTFGLKQQRQQPGSQGRF